MIPCNKICKSAAHKEFVAFEEVFRFNYPRLNKYACHFVHNNDIAEDFVQDAFLQLWNKRGDLNDENKIVAFLFTTLRNSCLNYLKRRVVEEKYIHHQSRMDTEALYALSFTQSSDFDTMEELLMRELEVMISEMPLKCGTAFRLRWIEGLKVKEIADKMEISTTMVDKHLARGMEIARRKLTPDLFLFFILCR